MAKTGECCSCTTAMPFSTHELIDIGVKHGLVNSLHVFEPPLDMVPV